MNKAIEQNAIDAYNEACNLVADVFIRKYFVEEGVEFRDIDYDWVAGDIGGVLNVGDYWFNMGDMTDALKYEATSEQMFGYYDKSFDAAMESKPVGISFKNYIKYGDLTNDSGGDIK